MQKGQKGLLGQRDFKINQSHARVMSCVKFDIIGQDLDRILFESGFVLEPMIVKCGAKTLAYYSISMTTITAGIKS